MKISICLYLILFFVQFTVQQQIIIQDQDNVLINGDNADNYQNNNDDDDYLQYVKCIVDNSILLECDLELVGGFGDKNSCDNKFNNLPLYYYTTTTRNDNICYPLQDNQLQYSQIRVSSTCYNHAYYYVHTDNDPNGFNPCPHHIFQNINVPFDQCYENTAGSFDVLSMIGEPRCIQGNCQACGYEYQISSSSYDSSDYLWYNTPDIFSSFSSYNSNSDDDSDDDSSNSSFLIISYFYMILVVIYFIIV
jgi:hypothetical protein